MSLGGWMSFTLFIGAAWNDGSPTQRAELSIRIQPLLNDLREEGITPARVRQLVQRILEEVLRIMGDGWQMPEDYREQIEVLLRDRHAQ